MAFLSKNVGRVPSLHTKPHNYHTKPHNPVHGDMYYDLHDNMVKTYNSYTNMWIDQKNTVLKKWEWCDDLDAPQFCVILDKVWWNIVRSQVQEWFESIGCGKDQLMIGQYILYIPDPKVRTMFALKWT